MVDGLSLGHALLWVLVAVAAAVAVLWADALRRWRAAGDARRRRSSPCSPRTPPPGSTLALLKPRRIDELGAGLSHGAEALANVQLPYAGADPWPSADAAAARRAAVRARGAAGVLAARQRAPAERAARRGYPFLALALLLVLVAAPVVSLGGDAAGRCSASSSPR